MYRVTCGVCKKHNYIGYEVRPIKSILKQVGFRCKFCNAKLSVRDPIITVKPVD